MPAAEDAGQRWKRQRIFGEEQGPGMTQYLAAPRIGGGEGCSLRAASDWLREEAA